MGVWGCQGPFLPDALLQYTPLPAVDLRGSGKLQTVSGVTGVTVEAQVWLAQPHSIHPIHRRGSPSS